MISRTSLNGKWPQVELGEVVNFLDNLRKPVTAKDRVPGPYPYYGANGQQDSVEDYIFDEPLILLAEDGGHFGDPKKTIAYSVKGKCWVNNHAHVLQPSGKIDIRYLCRHLENYDVRPFVSGTTRMKLNKQKASKIPLALPPLPEQKRIAAILDKADAVRRKRGEAYETTEEIVKSTFLNTFGDPVKNPNDWPHRPLGDIVSKLTDGEHLNPVFQNRGMPMIMAANVLHDGVSFEDIKSVAVDDGIKFRRKCGPDRNDLLIVSRGATIGRCSIVDTDMPFCLMGSVILVKPNNDVTSTTYLKWLFTHAGYYNKLFKTSGSSAQQAIYLTHLRELDVPVPPIELQRSFASQVEAIQSVRQISEGALLESANLFNSLVQRAFKGEL